MTTIATIVGALIALVLMLSIRVKALWVLFALFSAVNPAPVQLIASPSMIFGTATIMRTLRQAGGLLAQKITGALGLLAGVYLCSALWSSHPLAAVSGAFQIFAIICAVVLAAIAVSQSSFENVLRVTMLTLAPIAILQSLATAWFFFDPSVKDSYLHSEIFQLLLGNEGKLLFTTMPNNVTNPMKSGGLFFVNGNKASMVMAAWALAYLGIAFRRKSFIMFVLFAICITGSISTGSKTAAILALVIVPVFFVLPSVFRARRSMSGFGIGLIGLTLLSITLAYVGIQLSKLFTGLDDSAAGRDQLWTAAANYFRESPFLGLGSGGWLDRWTDDPARGNFPALPPHNFLVFNWANAGIIAPILILAVFALIFAFYSRAIANAETMRLARANSYELGIIVWIFAHGMFDNTDFFGTPNTLPLFALVIARVVTDARMRAVTATSGEHVLARARSESSLLTGR